jgi:hypothetical protein
MFLFKNNNNGIPKSPEHFSNEDFQICSENLDVGQFDIQNDNKVINENHFNFDDNNIVEDSIVNEDVVDNIEDEVIDNPEDDAEEYEVVEDEDDDGECMYILTIDNTPFYYEKDLNEAKSKLFSLCRRLNKDNNSEYKGSFIRENETLYECMNLSVVRNYDFVLFNLHSTLHELKIFKVVNYFN